MFMDTCYHYRHFPIQKTWSFTKQKIETMLEKKSLTVIGNNLECSKGRAASLLLVPHQTSSVCLGHWLSNSASWLVGRTTQE